MDASPTSKVIPITDNLRAMALLSDDMPNAAIIYFQAKEKEEEVCFEIKTSVPILEYKWSLPQLKGGHWLALMEQGEQNRYAICVNQRILDHPFIVKLKLDTKTDPRDHIASVTTWSLKKIEPQVVYIKFE